MPPLRMVLFLVMVSCARVLGGETATAVATVAAGYVAGITVTSRGSGYVKEPSVTLTGGGGSGATAKAVLSGDKVALVVVLTAGSGYSEPPSVVIEAPPLEPVLVLEMVPKLTVEGTPGTVARVEWAEQVSGPWNALSNVVVNAEGTVLFDLAPVTARRFYRAVISPRPLGPPGFVWIPPGTFVMGSLSSEAGRNGDETQHTVTLTQGFWLSDHEVTQEEYFLVTGVNPSAFADASRPVEQVTWNDAASYCQKLTERERAAGRIRMGQEYRLPTEAEWEYAARAGTADERHGLLDAIAWWSGNSGGAHRVGKQKAPNAFGLYDMIGNVWEWCADWYGTYSVESVVDPKGPTAGVYRVGRGGSWQADAAQARSAFRGKIDPGYKDYNLGFRVALGLTP